MSQENVEIVRSTLEPFDGVNLAAIDWSAEVIREALGRAYSPDIELTTLAIPPDSTVGDGYRGLGRRGRVPASGWSPSASITSRTSTTSKPAIAFSFPAGSGALGAKAAPGSSSSSRPSTRCETVESHESTNTTPWRRPSKPPGSGVAHSRSSPHHLGGLE